MAKKHSFAKGVATGVLGTAATVAGAVFAKLKKLLSNQKKRNWLSSKKIVKKQLAPSCKSLIMRTRKPGFYCYFYSSSMTRNGAKFEKKKYNIITFSLLAFFFLFGFYPKHLKKNL